jgi:hypothetical protein
MEHQQGAYMWKTIQFTGKRMFIIITIHFAGDDFDDDNDDNTHVWPNWAGAPLGAQAVFA